MAEEKKDLEQTPEAESTEEKKPETMEDALYSWGQALVTAVVGVVILFTFFFRLIGVNGPSMQDTLYTGDRLLVINSLLVLPAAAARNVARTMQQYHLFSLLGAVLSGVAGLMTSYYVGGSAGAAITLYLAVWFALTFLVRKK